MYHSALTEPEKVKGELELFEIKDSIAFCNDITICHYPRIFEKCDLIYSELAWKSGIEEFNKRADRKVSFKDYSKSICKLIKEFDNPIFLITGFCDVSNYPIPYDILKTTLNGSECDILIYHAKGQIKSEYLRKIKKDANFLLDLLISYDEFQNVGDFNCGYGKVGLEFYKKGKNFVMSDYNKKCIYQIKELIQPF